MTEAKQKKVHAGHLRGNNREGQKAVKAALTSHKWTSTNDLVDLTGRTRTVVSKVCKALLEAGEIEVTEFKLSVRGSATKHYKLSK